MPRSGNDRAERALPQAFVRTANGLFASGHSELAPSSQAGGNGLGAIAECVAGLGPPPLTPPSQGGEYELVVTAECVARQGPPPRTPPCKGGKKCGAWSLWRSCSELERLGQHKTMGHGLGVAGRGASRPAEELPLLPAPGRVGDRKHRGRTRWSVGIATPIGRGPGRSRAHLPFSFGLPRERPQPEQKRGRRGRASGRPELAADRDGGKAETARGLAFERDVAEGHSRAAGGTASPARRSRSCGQGAGGARGTDPASTRRCRNGQKQSGATSNPASRAGTESLAGGFQVRRRRP